MLYIHTSRENYNKEKFVFETIKGNAIVLVPDQYTVQAEGDAFFYTKKKALMDLEVLSFSRLIDRVFQQAGGDRIPMIDRQGRHMLLTRIMGKMKEQLTVYKNYVTNSAFIELANDFIAETKQFGRNSQDLLRLAQKVPKEHYLYGKLQDMSLLFEEYQQEIDGKYLDTEDRINFMMERMEKAPVITGNEFWIYGFDYFAPRSREILCRLAQLAPAVHVVMTYDTGSGDEELFHVTERAIGDLVSHCEKRNIATSVEAIDVIYQKEMAPTMAAIEKNLFRLPITSCDNSENLKLVRASGLYKEAEAAAAEVRRLVEEEGMRYRDIALICNDTGKLGKISKRIFARYDMELILDEKRKITAHPAVTFVLALLNSIAGAYRPQDVIAYIKTGFADILREEAEIFEDYVVRYRISGPRFRQSFTKGEAYYGKDNLEKIEDVRQRIIGRMQAFGQEYKKEKTVSSRVKALYGFLQEECRLPEKIDLQMGEDAQNGFVEAAGESAQVYNVIVKLLEQMVDVFGDETISQKDFAQVFRSGCEAVEIGLIPPVADGLLMGSMERTRLGRIKALLVLGVNEGVLPSGSQGTSIFSEEERTELLQIAGDREELVICKEEAYKINEENLAIYRNFCKPTKELWVSCSQTDGEGKAIRPSTIFDVLKEICPEIPVEGDLSIDHRWLSQISSKEAAAVGLSVAIQQAKEGGHIRENNETAEIDPRWQLVAKWFQKNQPQRLEKLKEGMEYTVREDPISPQLAGKLYAAEKDFSLSPSRLELFGRCPFAHFVRYGIRPKTFRSYEAGALEQGDLYHRCLQQLASLLSQENIPISDPDSLWQTITRQKCDAAVEGILNKELQGYQEGVFSYSQRDAFRGRQLKENCKEICWNMILHVRHGQIEDMKQEISFGRGKAIPPITVDTPQGTVYIEGTIDRVDYLQENRVKVIDYKSGKDSYNPKEATGGWKLQLFLYLDAACEGHKRKPVGAYYFPVRRDMISADGLSYNTIKEDVESILARSFRMDGFTLQQEDAIADMDKEFEDASAVLPISRNKSGELKKSANKLLSQKEMDTLLENVEDRIADLCRELREGSIAVEPRKTKSITACTYCEYNGICKFDVRLDGCRYTPIE